MHTRHRTTCMHTHSRVCECVCVCERVCVHNTSHCTHTGHRATCIHAVGQHVASNTLPELKTCPHPNTLHHHRHGTSMSRSRMSRGRFPTASPVTRPVKTENLSFVSNKCSNFLSIVSYDKLYKHRNDAALKGRPD